LSLPAYDFRPNQHPVNGEGNRHTETDQRRWPGPHRRRYLRRRQGANGDGGLSERRHCTQAKKRGDCGCLHLKPSDTAAVYWQSKTLSYFKRQSAEFLVVQEKFLDAASKASLTKKISMWQSISYK
jgi:hypothetical protein